jgi:hypothetical protein
VARRRSECLECGSERGLDGLTDTNVHLLNECAELFEIRNGIAHGKRGHATRIEARDSIITAESVSLCRVGRVSSSSLSKRTSSPSNASGRFSSKLPQDGMKVATTFQYMRNFEIIVALPSLMEFRSDSLPLPFQDVRIN